MPWYGELPERWESKRIGALLQQRKEKNDPVTTNFILSLSSAYGVVPFSERVEKGGNKPKDDLTKYFIAHENDLLVNCMNVLAGSCGVSKWHGAISPVYYALYPRNANDIDIWYFNYIFRLVTFYRSLIGISKGILVHESSTGSLNTIRLRIAMQNMNYTMLPLPPRDEQDQIVRYLDWKVSQINKLINAKRRQIELLGEMKRAVVNEAVTKGGEGWKTMRFRFLCKITTGNKDTINRIDKGIYPFYVRSPKIERINTYSYDGEAILMAGDGVGAGRVFHYATGRFDYHQRVYCFFDFDEKLHVRYLHYYMAELFPGVVDKGTAKSTVDSIRLNMIQDFIVAVPSYSEQHAIVVHLDKQCANIDGIIAKLNEEITLFSEYRTRLISDVVTGKMDVRGVVVPDYEVVREAEENANNEDGEE